MRKTKENGITLIALIITIIVMLILVGVTVNVALNGGLFETAKDAANRTQIEADREVLQAAIVGALDENLVIPNADSLKNNLPERWEVTGSDGGPYTATSPNKNEFVVDENGKIIPNSGEETLELFEKYILGTEKTGRPLTDIFDLDEFIFIDDPETSEVDETRTLGVKVLLARDDNEKAFIYVEYDNKAYKIIVDGPTLDTEKIELIYEKQGREGEKISYDSNLDGTPEEWMILYQNGNNIEIVSLSGMGELTLGYSDETAKDLKEDIDGNGSIDNKDKAIYSYNNAITRINSFCDSLVKNQNKLSVRSFGSDPSNPNKLNDPNDESSGSMIPFYESTNIVNIAGEKYNGIGKSGNEIYIEDLVRFIMLSDELPGGEYWIPCRYVYDSPLPSGCLFSVGLLKFFDPGYRYREMLILIYSNSLDGYDSGPHPVLPVVKLPSDAL